ncbi:MAG: cysteine desulfurase family protein [Planctomycetota bacterium]
MYLDNHATTPLDERVLEAMLPYLGDRFGNASSRSHGFGHEAAEAVDRARDQVAALLRADPREIVFTSGATESNNLAIKGAAEARRPRGNHIITTTIEHPAVLAPVELLETRGYAVTRLAVDPLGRVAPAALAAAITDQTILVSVMGANAEIGTIEPLAEIGALTRAKDIWLHSDATQLVGKVPFTPAECGVDLASLTGHKIHGPKGCGALYVRRGIDLAPQQHGGGQERGVRPGTLNVPGIVGLGMACELARTERETDAAHCARLRDRLQERLFAELDGLSLNGDPDNRLPNNLHVSFDGVDAQTLMMAVPEIAVSAGAACGSGSIKPSHVLDAIGVPDKKAASSIRFGIGKQNTEDEIDEAAGRFVDAVKKLRN